MLTPQNEDQNDNASNYTYIEFGIDIFDVDCLDLNIKMTVGSNKEFKIVVDKAHEMLNPMISHSGIGEHPSMDIMVNDTQGELVPNLDS